MDKKQMPLALLLDSLVGKMELGVRGPRFVRTQPVTPRDARPCGRNDPCPCGSGKKYKRCCRTP